MQTAHIVYNNLPTVVKWDLEGKTAANGAGTLWYRGGRNTRRGAWMLFPKVCPRGYARCRSKWRLLRQADRSASNVCLRCAGSGLALMALVCGRL